MLPTKFRVNWLFSSEDAKKGFQDGCHGGHLGYLIRTILAILDVQVILMFPSSFESIGLSVQEKKRKIDFEDDRF